MNVAPTRARLSPATPLRLDRLKVGIPLYDLAREAGLSLSRASLAERFPENARPGEIERLRAALERVARTGA
jgi:hypothetical protein